MLEQPDIEPIKRRLYRLRQTYVLEYRGRKFTCLSGFEYDGGSVPRALWTLAGITPDGLGRPAFLIHDLLYECNGRPDESEHLIVDRHRTYSRSRADRLFRRMLFDCDVSEWRAQNAFRGVRLGGGAAWRKHQRSGS